MPQLNLRFQHPQYNDADLVRSIQSILDGTDLLSLATISDQKAWINTAYYCYGDDLALFFLSEPSTQHCKNLEHDSTAAAAIFDSHQPWGPGKRGLQVFGRCE